MKISENELKQKIKNISQGGGGTFQETLDYALRDSSLGLQALSCLTSSYSKAETF